MLTLHEYTKKIAYNTLIYALEALPGPKDVILDESLMKPLDQIASIHILKNHGVIKIFKLDSVYFPSSKLCAFILRPTRSNFLLLQRHLNMLTSHEIESYVMYIPSNNYISDQFLEKEGLYDLIAKVIDLSIHFIPIEQDLFSMDLQDFYRETFNLGDTSNFLNIAKSLQNIQQTYGTFEQIITIGKKSQHICDLIHVLSSNESLSSWEDEGDNCKPNDGIPILILFDRDIDYVTPFCTALTYESLLDRTFGINSGFVEVPQIAAKGQEAGQGGKVDTKCTVKLRLSSDKVFQDIKNCHFSFVSQILKIKSRELQTTYEKGQASIADMKDFINKQLKDLKSQQKSLAQHIDICEKVIYKSTHDIIDDFQAKLTTEQSSLLNPSLLKKELVPVQVFIKRTSFLSNILQLQDHKTCLNYIEDLMLKQPPLTSVLSLMCLLSNVQGGIMVKDYEKLKTNFLHLYTLADIWISIPPSILPPQKVGLFYPRLQSFSSKVFDAIADPLSANSTNPIIGNSWFSSASSKLNSLHNSAINSETVDLKNPSQMSYIYNGVYEPLSCQLIQNILMDRDSLLDELSKIIPRATYKRNIQNTPKHSSHKPSSSPSLNGTRKALIFFVGGCTYGEVAALRFLAKQLEYHLYIATTAFTNGSQMLYSLLTDFKT